MMDLCYMVFWAIFVSMLASGPVAAARVQAQPASRPDEEAVETRSVTFRVLGLMKTKSGAT